MSLQTPDKIRALQRKLYRKAKAEPAFRFYVLYDKICRDDILRHAYRVARANAGSPGVDGVTFARIEAAGVEEWLAGLREELVSKTYRPQSVRRVMIPKPGGGERPLGIPTIRDRVVQTAAKLVLEPIFEADFEDSAYGYRPNRGGGQAVKEVHRLICRGYTDVVDADLSGYFDSIPHSDLLRSVSRRVVDRHTLRLIKMWLKAPVEERDGDGKRRMSGGRNATRGTPQGGVASPLLANIYMALGSAHRNQCSSCCSTGRDRVGPVWHRRDGDRKYRPPAPVAPARGRFGKFPDREPRVGAHTPGRPLAAQSAMLRGRRDSGWRCAAAACRVHQTSTFNRAGFPVISNISLCGTMVIWPNSANSERYSAATGRGLRSRS